MPSAGNRLNRAMLPVSALILLAIVGVSYREWRQFTAANADAARSTEIRERVDRLLSSLLDAETGQRGFLLTGAEQYLEPYNRATSVIPVELENLKRLPASRAAEAGEVARLDNLVKQKLAELRQAIDLRRAQQSTPALDVVLSDRGKRTMDEIRAICSGIERRQY